MKFRILFSLLALLFVTGLSAQSTAERAGKRAKNRAENRANNKVDRKVDEAVDEAFDAVTNLFKKKKKTKKPANGTPAGGQSNDKTNDRSNGSNANDSASGQSPLSGMLGGGPWEPYTNPVTFSVRMEMTEEKKNGKKQDTAIDMSVTTDQFGIRIADADNVEQTRMILDTRDGKTTMVTTDKKGETTALRMRIPGVKQYTEDTMEDYMNGITIEETNETRVIDGYNCRKYIVTDTKRNTVTESWITKDAGVNSQEVFSGMMNAFGSRAKKQKGGPGTALAGNYEGFPILSVSDDGKSVYTTRFKNLKVGEGNTDRSILDLSGLDVQELGF